MFWKYDKSPEDTWNTEVPLKPRTSGLLPLVQKRKDRRVCQSKAFASANSQAQFSKGTAQQGGKPAANGHDSPYTTPNDNLTSSDRWVLCVRLHWSLAWFWQILPS